MIHREIIVRGKVQGVYYRATARSVGVRLGLTGTVKNDPDGSVRIVAEGAQPALDEFISWCRTGPTGATVTELDITEGPLENIDGFEILHG